jgi:hypothetical protein
MLLRTTNAKGRSESGMKVELGRVKECSGCVDRTTHAEVDEGGVVTPTRLGRSNASVSSSGFLERKTGLRAAGLRGLEMRTRERNLNVQPCSQVTRRPGLQ